MVGKSLGPYKILEPLGAGGMGEVFLAEDTRLGRKVAIKVLPEQFASDPARLARFEQEARASAALNHPHIAVVHDVGAEQPDGDGATVHFMVQEYLEGQTMRDALGQGALAVKRAVDLGAEIAEALAAAHDGGIVHRDLKPANVFVTREGHAKVLDFGLAKLVEPEAVGGASDSSRSPTMLGTVAGQVMGTAGYMAPEQVRGEEIDQRADIFAFGCLMYEMASGKQAFSAASALDTLHAIVHDDPQPLGHVNPNLPAELQRILKKCLAKEAAGRYQTAQGLATDMRSLAAEVEAGTAVPLGSATSISGATTIGEPPGRSVSVGLAAAVVVLVAVVAGIGGWALQPPPAPPPERPLRHFEIDLGATQLWGGGSKPIAVSPDGSLLVYSGGNATTGDDAARLHIRPIDQTEVRPLPGTEWAQYPTFSPDGQWILYQTVPPAARGEPRRLMKVSIEGGEPFALCDCYGAPTWADDGNVYFGPGTSTVLDPISSIWRVPSAGGDPQLLYEPEPPAVQYRRPFALPGGEWLLIQVDGTDGSASIAAASVDGDTIHPLISDGTNPRYAPTGHIVYARGNALFAVAFDADRLEVIGEPSPVVQGVFVGANGIARAAFGADGTLAYFAGAPAATSGFPQYALVWVDRDGERVPVTERTGPFGAARLSPDWERIAVESLNDDGRRQIFILGIEDDTFVPLNNDGQSLAPLWTPDGSRVVFNWEAETTGIGIGALGGIYVRDADFGSEREQLLQTDGGTFPHSWSGDGEDLVLHEMIEGSADKRRIMVMDFVGEDRTAYSPYDPSGQFNQRSPVVSPDGRWVAYVSAQSGQDEVYVRPFPDSGPRIPISNNGGIEPMWGADSTELFYREVDAPRTTMVSVRLETEPEMRVLDRTELFDGFFWFMGNRARTVYDYDRVNDRFLMVDVSAALTGDDDEDPSLKMHVLIDWFDDLKRRVPGEGR